MAQIRASSTAPASDRPLAPRLLAELDHIDLATIETGEHTRVELFGMLPDDFDEALLLNESRLGRASLVAAQVRGSRLVDVTISGCDLSGIDWDEASLTRVEIIDARLSSAQLCRTRLRDVRFVECRIDDVNFAMATAERVRFQGCQMQRTDFRAARFAGVAWWECDLTDAEFSQITLERAQMHGSRIDGVRGAADLRPISIDDDQRSAFAEHWLAAMGVTVAVRDD